MLGLCFILLGFAEQNTLLQTLQFQSAICCAWELQMNGCRIVTPDRAWILKIENSLHYYNYHTSAKKCLFFYINCFPKNSFLKSFYRSRNGHSDLLIKNQSGGKWISLRHRLTYCIQPYYIYRVHFTQEDVPFRKWSDEKNLIGFDFYGAIISNVWTY